jgi:hypothetical protein
MTKTQKKMRQNTVGLLYHFNTVVIAATIMLLGTGLLVKFIGLVTGLGVN